MYTLFLPYLLSVRSVTGMYVIEEALLQCSECYKVCDL